LVFTGTHKHTIDSKNRLSVPSSIRAMVQKASSSAPDEPILWYVTLGEEGTSLCLYPQEVFERYAEELEESDMDPDDLEEVRLMLYSNAEQIEMDKAGRIRLPDHFLTLTEIGTDVVLLGVKDHLQIRNRQAWEEHLKATLKNNPKILMNMRRAAKQRKRSADEARDTDARDAQEEGQR
jgi:MraZ protein